MSLLRRFRCSRSGGVLNRSVEFSSVLYELRQPRAFALQASHSSAASGHLLRDRVFRGLEATVRGCGSRHAPNGVTASAQGVALCALRRLANQRRRGRGCTHTGSGFGSLPSVLEIEPCPGCLVHCEANESPRRASLPLAAASTSSR